MKIFRIRGTLSICRSMCARFERRCQNLIYTLLFTVSPDLITPFIAITLIRLTSSTLLFPRLKQGVTQIPHEHLIPCQAYAPTFEEHFGHSSFPSSSLLSRVDCIQSCGSRKKWAHSAGRIESTCARGLAAA